MSSSDCLKDSILPDLSRLVEQPSRTVSGSAGRSHSTLKMKPLSQFHDTYREAFQSRLFNPEKQYSSVGPAIKTKDLFNRTSKAKKLQGPVGNRLDFITTSLRLLEEYVLSNYRDEKLSTRVRELCKFVHLLTEQVGKVISEKARALAQEKAQQERLLELNSQLENQNQQLEEFNATLLKYERGVNQLKLSHQNDRLRLEVKELSRILGEKEKSIDALQSKVQQLTETQKQYHEYKANIDLKMDKLKQQLELSEHTRQLNLASKMKYLLGLD